MKTMRIGPTSSTAAHGDCDNTMKTTRPSIVLIAAPNTPNAKLRTSPATDTRPSLNEIASEIAASPTVEDNTAPSNVPSQLIGPSGSLADANARKVTIEISRQSVSNAML